MLYGRRRGRRRLRPVGWSTWRRCCFYRRTLPRGTYPPTLLTRGHFLTLASKNVCLHSGSPILYP